MTFGKDFEISCQKKKGLSQRFAECICVHNGGRLMELTKEQAKAVKETIRSCVANESARDLATYSDMAIRELLRRKGVEVSVFNVGYYRQMLKIPGVPTRLRNLIEGVKA